CRVAERFPSLSPRAAGISTPSGSCRDIDKFGALQKRAFERRPWHGEIGPLPLRLDAEMRSSKARLCGRADQERDQGLALPDCEWAKRRGWSLINGEVNRALAVAPIERRKQPFRTARLGRLRSAAVQVCSDGVCF